MHDIERGENERDAVGNGEGGDDFDDLAKPADDNKSDEEANVVVAEKDVLDAHLEEPPEPFAERVLGLRRRRLESGGVSK